MALLIPVGNIAKKNSLLLIRHSKYSAMLSKTHPTDCFFWRFCPLRYFGCVDLGDLGDFFVHFKTLIIIIIITYNYYDVFFYYYEFMYFCL